MTDNSDSPQQKQYMQHVQASNYVEMRPQGIIVRVAETESGSEVALLLYHDELRIDGEAVNPVDDDKYIFRIVRVQDLSIIMDVDGLIIFIKQILGTVDHRSPGTLARAGIIIQQTEAEDQ